LLLQGVGANLVRQADAPALLAQVDDQAVLLGDLTHRAGELGAAVAFEGSEGLTSQALAVNPARDPLFPGEIPVDQGHVLPVFALHAEDDGLEGAVLRRQLAPGQRGEGWGSLRSFGHSLQISSRRANGAPRTLGS